MPIGEAASDAAAESDAAEVVLRKRTQFGVRINIYIYLCSGSPLGYTRNPMSRVNPNIYINR